MLQNYNFYKVLSIFLDNPTKGFGWKELSKMASLGPPSVKNYLDQLEKESIIIKKQAAGRNLYFSNRESRIYKLYKKFDIIMKMEKTGLIDFMNKEYGYPTIILYGSYSLGESVEESDIDIAIITESKKDAGIKEFETKVGKQIQIFKFTKEEFNNLRKKRLSIYNGIINGIVLSGYLDAI